MIPLPALSFSCVSNRVSHSARSKILTAYRAGLSRRRSFRISCIGSSAGPARFPAGPVVPRMFSVVFLSARGAAISLGRPVREEECPADRTGHRFSILFPALLLSARRSFPKHAKRQPDKSCLFLCQRTGPVPGGLSFLSYCHRCLSESYTTPPVQVFSAAAGAVSMDRSIIPAEAHGSHLHSPVSFSFYPKPYPCAIPMFILKRLYAYVHPVGYHIKDKKKPPPREALFISF